MPSGCDCKAWINPPMTFALSPCDASPASDPIESSSPITSPHPLVLVLIFCGPAQGFMCARAPKIVLSPLKKHVVRHHLICLIESAGVVGFAKRPSHRRQ